MPVRHRGLVATVATLALLAAAAGCSGGSDGSSPAGTLAREPGSEARRGGVLRVGVERPPSLDPALARTVPQSDLVVADLLFDGLTAYDPASGEAAPAVAASWEASEDARRWTFRLDPDARFSDGSPITPTDVRYSLVRARSLRDESEAALLLEDVEGIDADDDAHAVRIRLGEPFATLPLVLTSPQLAIVPRSAVEAAEAGGFGSLDSAAQLVGSGPFAVAEGGAPDGGTLSLERAAGREAFLDGVEVHLFDTLDASYESFTAGQLDWTLVPSAALVAAIDNGSGQVTPYQAVLFYGINLRDPVFADRRFREAIVRAVDREAIAREVYGLTMKPLAAVVGVGTPGGASNPCGDACSYDPERARSLVEETFGGRPVHRVRVDFDAGGRQDTVAAMIVDGLRAAGIPAEARPRPFEEYGSFVVSGNQAMFRLGWTGGYPSADAYLAPLFRSGSPDNVVGFSIDAVDSALDEARREVDAGRRRSLLADAERMVMERLPIVPIGQFQTAWATSARVRDLRILVSGTFDGAKVWLAGGS